MMPPGLAHGEEPLNQHHGRQGFFEEGSSTPSGGKSLQQGGRLLSGVAGVFSPERPVLSYTLAVGDWQSAKGQKRRFSIPAPLLVPSAAPKSSSFTEDMMMMGVEEKEYRALSQGAPPFFSEDTGGQNKKRIRREASARNSRLPEEEEHWRTGDGLWRRSVTTTRCHQGVSSCSSPGDLEEIEHYPESRWEGWEVADGLVES